MTTPEAIRHFWTEEVGPKGWYNSSEALDAEIRSRFGAAWHEAMSGGLTGWLSDAPGTLSYLLLTDQFPRNMFRDSAQAFASDGLALSVAKRAILRDLDLHIDGPLRQFFYLPLMHSESLPDQDRCVRLMLTRMPESGHVNMLHARAHRAVIRQFGRFPYRNAALGRESTPEEVAYLAAGGYGRTVADLQAQKAA